MRQTGDVILQHEEAAELVDQVAQKGTLSQPFICKPFVKAPDTSNHAVAFIDRPDSPQGVGAQSERARHWSPRGFEVVLLDVPPDQTWRVKH